MLGPQAVRIMMGCTGRATQLLVPITRNYGTIHFRGNVKNSKARAATRRRSRANLDRFKKTGGATSDRHSGDGETQEDQVVHPMNFEAGDVVVSAIDGPVAFRDQ
jgi:hypothetical protein